MPLLISIAIFMVLTGAISFYGYRLYARSARVMARLQDRAAGESSTAVTGLANPILSPARAASAAKPGPLIAGRGSFLVDFIQVIGEQLPTSPAEVGITRRYLMAAGLRSDSGPAIFNGCKILAAAALVVLVVMFGGKITGNSSLRMGLMGAAGFVGWSLPGVVLDRLVARRLEKLRFALPDALDLMVVCAEAGLGLDQSFVNVSRDLRSTHPDLCDELSLVTLETRAGTRREDALHNLAERCQEQELRKLVAVLIQSDRFGTNIGESLRTHSDYLRIRRHQEAEERAAKVGVKLVFPIFFCILPAMMVVTGGPGVIQIFRTLIPLMKQIH